MASHQAARRQVRYLPKREGGRSSPHTHTPPPTPALHVIIAAMVADQLWGRERQKKKPLRETEAVADLHA